MTAPTDSKRDDDIEILSRYIDGELPANDSRALEARLHDDADLRAQLVKLEELNPLLSDALSERGSIPETVLGLLDQQPAQAAADTGNVVSFPSRGAAAAVNSQPRWGFAMAASLAAAVALSLVLSTDKSPSLPGNDALVSQGLDQQASGSDWAALGDGRELQPVLTFPHEDGRWCREYLLRGGDADWRAVACREGDRWVTQAAGLESFLDSTEAYRPAGAADSASVAVFIRQNAGDIALGLSEEKALLDNGWQR